MSAREFNKEERRLRRAKEEMLQVLSLLEDPASYMKDSDLTQDEKTRLVHESQSLMAEIQIAIARLHSKETSIIVNGVMVNIMGPTAELLRVAGGIPSHKRLVLGPKSLSGDISVLEEEGVEPQAVAGGVPSHPRRRAGPQSSTGRNPGSRRAKRGEPTN